MMRFVPQRTYGPDEVNYRAEKEAYLKAYDRGVRDGCRKLRFIIRKMIFPCLIILGGI
jgi:hypothetical protein